MRLKYFTLLLLLLFSFGIANAQCEVTNGSFEEWIETDLILPDGGNGEASGEVILPEGCTPFLRLIFLAFAATFNPSYGMLLETEAQEMMGILQSTDASDGDFAIRLQSGYGVELADIYSVSSCTEVPEQFNLDVKHVGETNDTFRVFVIFDQGLNPVPESEEDLENIPAYAATSLVFDTTTEYETLSLPIIQNFEVPIDTFYYLIIAETFDSSYFLVDNVSFGEDDGCPVVAPTISLENEGPFCICNNLDVMFPLEYMVEANTNYKEVIIDADGVIVSIDESISGVHYEFCHPTDDLRMVVVAYIDDLEGLNEGNTLDDLVGCFELSNVLDLNTYTLPKFGFNVFVDGEEQDENIDICIADDIINVMSFSTDTPLDNIAILMLDDSDALTVLRIDDVDETTELMGIEPGSYSMGAISYDGSFNLEVGQVSEDLTFEGCFTVSNDIYEVNLLGSDDNCAVNVENVYTGNLKVRPNHSTGIFNIENPNNEAYDLVVRDLTGKTIATGNHKTLNGYLNLSDLPNGMYVLAFNIDGYNYIEKIIKM